MHGQCDARPTVTFPAAKHHRPLTDTKLYSFVTATQGCHAAQTKHITIIVNINNYISTAWIDNIKSWTGLSVEESIRMTEDRDKWRKYVHGVANPWIEDG